MRGDLSLSVVVGLAAAMMLLVLAPVYQVEHFYVAGQPIMSNDQVGYLTAARRLLDTGELGNHLIFPAYVREPAWRLYMPAQYYVLASGYVLFGAGPIAWRMPALLCFVLSGVGVFLIGRRYYDRASGAAAALLFLVFPPVHAFAFTAMPQLPFTAASVGSFCIFSYLPARWRPICVPILLVGPFLFRETGALLSIPMALVLLAENGRRSWRTVMASVVGSTVLLYGVLAWQISAGKIALPLDGSRFNYANAFQTATPRPSAATRTHAVTTNFVQSIDELRWHARRFDSVFVSSTLMFLLALLAIIKGSRRTRSGQWDAIALGSGLLFVAMALILTTFYTWSAFRGLRAVLFTFPFLAVAIAPWFVAAIRSLGPGKYSRVVVVSALALASLVLSAGYWGSLRLASNVTPDRGARALERLENLDLDDTGLLIAPMGLSLDYVLRHYPIRWSFIPSNEKTLALLAETYPVGTIILRESELARSPRISEQAINDVGLIRTREFQHRLVGTNETNETYAVFERPR
jgi:4-amino-4-deoxy-L-arabinose transferase-like glycosyltransferase